MELIDANLFVKAAKNAFPFLGEIIQILMDKRPTIDPETLPIVQELREENIKLKDAFQDTFALHLIGVLDRVEKQLAQVTKERDSAIKDMKNTFMFDKSVCECCALLNNCLFADDTKFCRNWQWRGIQEVEDDTI